MIIERLKDISRMTYQEQEIRIGSLKDNVILSKKFEPCILWQIGYNKGTY